MHRVRQQDLPFKGSSHQFVGADQGDVKISVFLLRVPSPAGDPVPIAIRMMRFSSSEKGGGRYVVNGEEFEAGAGDILVIKAGEIHSFQCIGDEPLVQVDVHLSPRFIQENLSLAAIGEITLWASEPYNGSRSRRARCTGSVTQATAAPAA